MTTLSDLVFQTRAHLNGQIVEDTNRLTNPVSATTGQDVWTCDFDTATIPAGSVVAVDLEVCLVWAVDGNAKTVTVQRGYAGSTVAAHSAGALVVAAPRFTDFRIAQAINNELRSLSSLGLFQMKTDTLTYSPAVMGYDLGDASVIDVYEVRWDITGPTKAWPKLRSWVVERNMPTADFPSATVLRLNEPVIPGRRVQVRYKAPYASLANLTDDVLTVAGLQDSAHDIPPIGAAIRLMASQPDQRATLNVQGSTRRAAEVTTTDVINAANPLRALRAQRILEERARLLAQYPMQLVV